MKTPEKIYISPSIRTEIAYYSRILIGNPTFNICPRYGNEIEYVRADIHEAEIDVTQTALRLMNKTAEVMHKEINALKAELTALKGGPDYKSILFALCASLSIQDTMGDVWEDTVEALKQAGLSAAKLDRMDEFQDILRILPKPVMTLYGPVDEEE